MTHKDLTVWKMSMKLVVKVYKITNKLPKKEQYSLASQVNRAAISIPSNISEGVGRSTTKEYLRFLDFANGSLCELETQLILIQEIGYADTQELTETDLTQIRKMLYRLKQSLRKRL